MSASPAVAFQVRNALTFTGLLFGIVAVMAAQSGRLHVAGALVALAALADLFDGQFSRLFASDERGRLIGGELDSLCDACVFGLAPPVCSGLLSGGAFGWTTAFFWSAGTLHVACTVARLAYFNVTRGEYRGFVGVPAPVAALMWSTVVLLTPGPLAVGTCFVITCIAMVAPIRIPRPAGASLAAFACWPVALVLAHLA